MYEVMTREQWFAKYRPSDRRVSATVVAPGWEPVTYFGDDDIVCDGCNEDCGDSVAMSPGGNCYCQRCHEDRMLAAVQATFNGKPSKASKPSKLARKARGAR